MSSYSCWIWQQGKVCPPFYYLLFFAFVCHLCIALDLGTRICWEKILSPQYLRFSVISVILQAELKLIWVLFACCYFIFNHQYFDQHTHILLFQMVLYNHDFCIMISLIFFKCSTIIRVHVCICNCSQLPPCKDEVSL